MRVGKASGQGWLRLSEAARELGVSLNTLRRWSDTGKLRAYRSPGGHRRFRRADVESLLRVESADSTPPPAGEHCAGTSRDADTGLEPWRARLQALAQVAEEGTATSACRIVTVADGDAPDLAASYGAADDVAGGPGRSFGPDMELIRGLGQVAAQALENATLFEQVERRSRILNELVELGSLASRTHDQPELLRAFAQRLLAVVDAGGCDIFQLGGDGLRCVASYDRSGLDEGPVGRLLDVEDYPTAMAAMQSGQVLVISGPDDAQLSENERRTYRELGYASEVYVPLVAGDTIYGLIDIYDTREREYTAYVSFLKSAGQALAGALESALLFAQIERRTAVLHEIVELGALTSQTHDLHELLRELASRLRDTVSAADCDIFALQHDRLRCLASARRDGFAECVGGAEVDMDRSPATAMAMRSVEATAVTSLDDPRLTPEERRSMAERGYQSELCIPLVSDDRVVGLIDVFDTRPRDYGDYFDFITSVAQIAAGAIANAALVDQLEKRNRALAELVELGKLVAGSAGMDHLVRAVGPRVVEVLGAAGCQVFALKDGRLHCVLTYEHGEYQDDYVGHPLDLDLFPSTRTALERRETLVVATAEDPRLSDYERELFVDSGAQSEVCVPFVADGRVVGMLDVYDERPRDYADHLDFLASVAQIVAGAFATAVLLERLETTNATLQTMVESGIEFGSSLDLEEVLQSVAGRLCALTEAPTCGIYAIEGELLRCVTCLDRGEPDRQHVGTTSRLDGLPLVQQALLTRTPTTVADLATDSRVSELERAEDLGRGHRSRLDLPLISGGAAIGIASLFDDHPREFADVDLLHSLAQVAANALANATLFERIDRSAARTALLSDVSYELTSSLDLAHVLRSAARRLCEVSGFPVCDVYRLREETLVNVVSVEDGEPDESWLGREVPLSAWTSLEAAITTRRPQSITSLDDPRLSAEERRLMEDYDQTADLIIPLVSRERVIGVLELLEKGAPRTPTEEELSTIVAVSRVAALAIDNADLIEDLQARNRENELLNEIARATGASLNLGDVAAGALEKLQRLTPFERAMVALAREEGTLEIAYMTPPQDVPTPRRIPLPPVEGLLRRLREERVVVLDLPGDLPLGLSLPGLDGLRAAAVILLQSGGHDIGVLTLGATVAGAFDEVDFRLLERVAMHLALAINNADLYEGIKRMHLSNLKALSSALNAKDYYTLGHAARVAAYMVLLGEELGWPADLTRQVEEAAYLHDIGKIGVSDRVLLKPSGLNTREWELMRQHPIFSADIIAPLFDADLVLGVRHHHERWDGGGYPDGLSGPEIPPIARAMCVADSYDAMSFRRPYRQAHNYPECLDELARCSGSQFDPVMVTAFTRVLGRITEGRERAAAVAAEAAARLDPGKHASLRGPKDEARPEYAEIIASLREVCRAHPPTSFISTHVRLGKKTAVIAGCGPNGAERPHIGDVVYSDDELLAVFEGRHLDANVLFVDQRGVWISGVAPLRDADGSVAAVVSADLPATGEDAAVEGLPSNVAQTFAAMLDTAAAQAGRSEVEAITDGLTGLYNHRYFHERLNEEIARAVETGAELALLFCDLDDFRAFNEFHGHGGGDHALRTVARIIESSVRHVDLAARYGGEEFAAILIDTGEQGALEAAERIRAGIAEAALSAGPITLSASIGVATCPADATFKEELIDKADWAMYLAKRRGRDRVMTFGAKHGSDTPEQAATVGRDYVATMSDLVTARETYERQRRAATAHLALAVARAFGLGDAELRAVAAASALPPATDAVDDPSRIVALAAAYQAMVADRPYRPQISEAEALDELLACPALMYDRPLADAFRRVLAGSRRA